MINTKRESCGLFANGKKRSSAYQKTVQWKSVSDCEWCHPEAMKMCRAGKRGPLWYYITPARLYHFGRFIKCHHNPHPCPPPPYIVHLWKEFQLWGNTCYMLIQGRCEEQRCCWSHWDCGAADVSSWQSCDLEHLRVLVLLEPRFQLVFFLTGVFDVLCRHRDWLVLLVMSWGTLSTGLLLESVIKKKSYFPLYN